MERGSKLRTSCASRVKYKAFVGKLETKMDEKKIKRTFFFFLRRKQFLPELY